jgi:hypothetical protein
MGQVVRVQALLPALVRLESKRKCPQWQWPDAAMLRQKRGVQASSCARKSLLRSVLDADASVLEP